MIVVLILSVFFLAFANGANDNFKGVATLLGSKTTSYKIALVWATLTTLSGSLLAFFIAQKLAISFSGKGLVPDEIVQLSSFSVSVALSAALTVFLATRLGFPISTTHALTGALVGAGFIASPGGVNLAKLYSNFFAPLLISPIIAILAALIVYPTFKLLKEKFNIKKESCLCIGNKVIEVAPVGFPVGDTGATLNVYSSCCPEVKIGTTVTCVERYNGQVMGIEAKTILDTFHFLSSGAVGFARGLNDTPKIAAILLLGKQLNIFSSIGMVAILMALGGIIYSKKIAETMSYQITSMNDGQGFTGNLITAFIVTTASKFGMPVSTTHVSCGALFGIGAVTKQAHWGQIGKIVLSWVITLPVAAILGMIAFSIFKGV
jgi:PiT family inorganic phosphate transporter